MAKSSIGDKQVCPDCESKFFDLGRKPPTCPKCGAVVEVVKVTAKAKSKPVPVPEAVPAPVKKAPESDDDEDEVDPDLELVEDIEDDLAEDEDEADDEEEEDKGLMEDASDLSDIEAEMSQVHVHVEGSDREGG